MKKLICLLMICIIVAIFSDSPIQFMEQEEIIASQVDIPWFDYKQYIYNAEDLDGSQLKVDFEVDRYLYNQEQGMNVKVSYKGRKFMKRYFVKLVDTIEPEITVAEDFRIAHNMTGEIDNYITIKDQRGYRDIPHKDFETDGSGYYIIKQNGKEIKEVFDTSKKGTQVLDIFVSDGRGHYIEEQIEFEVVDFNDFYVSVDDYLKPKEEE